MGNLISIAVHCGRGDEIIMGKNSHLFKYETGSPSGGRRCCPDPRGAKCAHTDAARAPGLLGLMCNTIPTQHNGTFMLRDIEDAIRPDDDHMPKTRLVSVENTHNECGGRVLPLSFLGTCCPLRLWPDCSRQTHAMLVPRLAAQPMCACFATPTI